MHTKWPKVHGILVDASNYSFEHRYGVEFVVVQKNMRIGYRYSDVEFTSDVTMDDFLERYHIDDLTKIVWDNDISPYRDIQGMTKISEITIKDFFEQYFSGSLFDLFLDRIKKAVRKANEDIGLRTIPCLSLRFLSSFKAELGEYIFRENYRGYRYLILEEKDRNSSYEKMCLEEKDYRIVEANYRGRRLYRALLGTEEFARCFITAEYLYTIFGEGFHFDYTSVVSGYLKCIEQLVYKIVLINLKYHSEDGEYWIKQDKNNKYPSKRADANLMVRDNPNNKRIKTKQVRFLPNNEKYFDITLAPLIWCLKDNKRYLVSETGAQVIHDLLIRYSKECRNEHFHKDNIHNFQFVKNIRNDTYLLAYFLLGGCILSGDERKDNELLGIIDESYERFYRKMIEIPRSHVFRIQFAGEEPLILHRLLKQDDPIYDEYGSLVKSTIKFVREESYTEESEDGGRADVTIDAAHIPQNVWLLTGAGSKEIKIEW